MTLPVSTTSSSQEIFCVTPIEYLKNIKLHGSLFEDCSPDMIVSCADTQFYVNHDEPLKVLKVFMDSNYWCLGNLLDGHEFLIIVPVSQGST
jgi:hypothetical protein